MASRLDELLRGHFYDALDDDEQAELARLVESNSAAADKLALVEKDKEEFANAPIPEEPKTKLSTRLFAIAMLCFILFGFIGMFWIRIEDNLIRDIKGEVLKEGEPIITLLDPADVSIEKETSFAIRGQTLVSTSGAELTVKERKHLAEFTLKSGNLEVERIKTSKDAIFIIAGIKLQLQKEEAKLSIEVEDAGPRLAFTLGATWVVNENDSEVAFFNQKQRLIMSADFDGVFRLEEDALALEIKAGKLKAHDQTYAKGNHSIVLYSSEEN